MKVATLTFHRAINYGAVLQTYALQNKIEQMGYDTEVVDYRNDFLEQLHNPKSLRKYGDVLHILYAFIKNRIKRNNLEKFETFRNENIKFSSIIYNNSTIASAELEYRLFIVGSDQVWNLDCSNGDKSYFLSFVKEKRKKNSYAASIGKEINSDDMRLSLYPLLSDFNCVSVRENKSRDELVEAGVKACSCLDPTLLLSKNDWSRIAKPIEKLKNKRFVLVYTIVNTKSIISFAKSLAERNGLEMIYINEYLFPQKRVSNLFYIGPDEWVWLFLNAEYIVTNSFHGLAFSVNFHKQFFVELLSANKAVNTRLIDFLKAYNLSERIIKPNESLFQGSINYEFVDLSKEIKKSEDVLNRVLKGECL